MEIIIIVCLILLNGIFAMSEIAVVSSRKSLLSAEAKQGGKLAKSALKLSENPERFLSTVQVGITLIGILTGLYSGNVLAEDFDDILILCGMSPPVAYAVAQGLIVIVVTYLTIVFGELVPKRIGMSAAETISKLMAKPMNALSSIAAPFVWVLSKSTTLVLRTLGIKTNASKVTEEEIKSLVQEGAQGGEVQAVERNIVERVFNLGDRDLESIMTHRVDIVWLDIHMSREEVIQVIRQNPYSKYPVADRTLDNLKGVVYLRELVPYIGDESFDLAKLIRTAPFFPESMGVYAALDEMKTKHLQYGFVCDEFGSIKGIVSHKDILEALVGTILEPHEESEIVRRQDGSYLVEGQCSFYNFLIHFDVEYLYSEHDFNTVSGLILELIGHIPVTGETLKWKGFVFEIMDMDGARIDKILVTRTFEEEATEDE